MIAPNSGLLNSLLDFACSEQLPLLEDLISTLLQLEAQWAQALGSWLLSVWVNVLVRHIVLHPIDV